MNISKECMICNRNLASRKCPKCGILYCNNCGNSLCSRCSSGFRIRK